MSLTVTELSVITKTKDLCSYVITATMKSPKQFRFTLVSKLQTYSLEGLENLYRANETRTSDAESLQRRRCYQREAMTNFSLLGYISQLATEQKCILPKQFEQITKKLYDCRYLLGAWMKSDTKRFGS